TDDNLDHKILFDIHREATAKAIHKAMANEPSIDWLLENQDEITHKYLIGPGLGEVTSNFSSVSAFGLWVSSFTMVLGRLEIFTLLVLLSPAFWSR
ncbi:MAG: formaldehyde-activating enzyme, partial [Pseudomonadota bacterium]